MRTTTTRTTPIVMAIDSATSDIYSDTPHKKQTAVGLSAPTGAGKTVIATAILERLILGDAGRDPNPDLTVLWLTDDPALNRQTIDKMLLASDRMTDDDFVEIDSTFDQPRLERGKVHFAHIHLFGKGTTSMHKSNSRENGLWSIIANTIERYGENFLLVRDEAHRGTEGNKRDATIVERISHGGTRDHFSGITQPPAPIVLGISATLDKFRAEMARPGRSLEEVPVDVAEVRESGLLKDRVIVRYPGENQPAEATLLEAAVDALKRSDAAWQAYTDATGTAAVEPLLVVQVKPGVTDDEMLGYLTVLEQKWNILKGDAIAHAFESKATRRLGDREIRYVAPERIAAETRLRVVFFKNALTTGWDCPRAEVMLSFRAAKDFTNIAQLIGRMVRTPKGERITGDESLNAVTLYLPHYDKNSVARVIVALGDDTGGDIDIVLDPVDCVQADVPKAVFDLLGQLPTDVRNKRPWKSEVDRLLGFARLLRQHDLLDKARAQVEARVVGGIRTEVEVHKDAIEALTKDVLNLDLAQTVFDYRHDMTLDEEESDSVHAGARDIEAQFATAVRTLPDASAKWYWNHLCDQMDPYDAKVQVAALTKTPEMAATFKTAVEHTAASQIDAWRKTYENQIATKGRQIQREFDAVWTTNSGTRIEDVVVPRTYSVATEKVSKDASGKATTTPIDEWDRHIYVAPAGHRVATEGRFPSALTGWEEDVLSRETEVKSLVGWYRNPPRSQHGLGIAYKNGDQTGVMYPDFIFFHEDEGIALDIVDPHRHNEADTGPKWAGLARWAAKNHDKVRRVVAVIKDADALLALDLTKGGIADLLDECHGKNDIEALFAKHGSVY